MAWCENSWCGHHRFENEIFIDSELITHQHQLSRSQVISRSSIDLPVFEDYESFIESDFFTEEIDLWIGDIRLWRDNNAQLVIRLQRMLIILWYMSPDDLFVSNAELQWWDSDAHAQDPNGWVYIEGYFSNMSHSAVIKFQDTIWIWNDGIVWDATKEFLYKTIYRFYHSYESINTVDIRDQVFKPD